MATMEGTDMHGLVIILKHRVVVSSAGFTTQTCQHPGLLGILPITCTFDTLFPTLVTT